MFSSAATTTASATRNPSTDQRSNMRHNPQSKIMRDEEEDEEENEKEEENQMQQEDQQSQDQGENTEEQDPILLFNTAPMWLLFRIPLILFVLLVLSLVSNDAKNVIQVHLVQLLDMTLSRRGIDDTGWVRSQLHILNQYLASRNAIKNIVSFIEPKTGADGLQIIIARGLFHNSASSMDQSQTASDLRSYTAQLLDEIASHDPFQSNRIAESSLTRLLDIAMLATRYEEKKSVFGLLRTLSDHECNHELILRHLDSLELLTKTNDRSLDATVAYMLAHLSVNKNIHSNLVASSKNQFKSLLQSLFDRPSATRDTKRYAQLGLRVLDSDREPLVQEVQSLDRFRQLGALSGTVALYAVAGAIWSGVRTSLRVSRMSLPDDLFRHVFRNRTFSATIAVAALGLLCTLGEAADKFWKPPSPGALQPSKSQETEPTTFPISTIKYGAGALGFTVAALLTSGIPFVSRKSHYKRVPFVLAPFLALWACHGDYQLLVQQTIGTVAVPVLGLIEKMKHADVPNEENTDQKQPDTPLEMQRPNQTKKR